MALEFNRREQPLIAMDEQIPFFCRSKESWERGELCSLLHARTTNASFIDKPRKEVSKAIKMLSGGDICAFPAIGVR
jgi:hypothetical protein